MTADKVTLDPEVAAWITAVLFPDPNSGNQGVTVQGIPGTPEFDAQVEMFTRAREQLGR